MAAAPAEFVELVEAWTGIAACARSAAYARRAEPVTVVAVRHRPGDWAADFVVG